MINPNYETGSFRDPGGRVFYHKNEVYREVLEAGRKRIEFIKSNNLLSELIDKRFLVKTELMQNLDDLKMSNNVSLILKHEKISFISYPYEWTFSQLKDAAIFHLDLQIYLLSKNAKLLDASAYNIQFKNNKPIFIDILSIDEYRDGDYWFGYRQFCENFLNPLILKSKKGIDFNNWFKGNLEGIANEDLYNVLTWRDFFSFPMFVHVFMQNKLNNKSKKRKIGTEFKIQNLKKLNKNSYLSIIKQLKQFIINLLPKKQFTSWEDYSTNNNYKKNEEETKFKIVKDFYKKHKIKTLLDLGCNDGKFSYPAAKESVDVVGLDFDLNVLDKIYNKAKNENVNFLPIYCDFSNPSSSLGWNERERIGINARARFDASISLAVIHHLAIAKNIPLDQAIKWIISFSEIGLIEFVPKNDETVKTMLALKGDIFPNYNEQNFEKILASISNIVNMHKVTNSNRKIYEYKNK